MLNYDILPEHMRGAMRRYIENRIAPGDFLTAVLNNDLMKSFALADHINRNRLHDFCYFLYNEAPAICYGSHEKVKAWLEGEE